MEKVSVLPVETSAVLDQLKERALALRSESLRSRKQRLRRLLDWINANRERIKAAVNADFNKPLLEVDTSEIYPVLTELRHAIHHLEEWARPVKVDATAAYLGTRSEIRFEPKGACLIIAPWNFPFNLCVGPLVSCLAAGNTACIKPSELTPHTSSLIREMANEAFEPGIVVVLEGGPEVSHSLIEQPFDHIFFTGSPAIGKVVMQAAAKNLTSVTLELGGKSPAIIDSSANISDAARRIAFGKFFNNGQACIAPDYILVEEKIRDAFIEQLRKQTLKLFGDKGTIGEESPNYSRIVNGRHYDRVSSLLAEAVQVGARPEVLGTPNSTTNFMPPVILTQVPMTARVMQEEIFGPLLPVVAFTNKEEVVRLVNAKPKPLALYVFTQKQDFREFVLARTSAGSVCINECVLQFTHPNLPFGGVNNSGIGKSHGRFGFLAFSNEKPVLRQKSGWAGPYLLHPPYTQGMKKVVDILLKWF
ncbi:MAG: aldehyde dehydrogenase family protein [Bacteroidetes bacterium]|nr:aldehyde dehydrogenase family protein [Bacteroidota bacterium]